MNTVATDLPPPVNHVFVDFENVHSVDLAVIGSKTVHLTLLLGPRQTKLDVVLVEKLLQHAPTVQLVRLGSAGRNALDFTLAYYIGRAVAADPTGIFHIVSKDAGYDPLIEHLRSKHIRARRHDDFSALTSSAPAKPPVTAPPPTPPTAASKPKSPPKPKTQLPIVTIVDEMEKRVLEHLGKPTTTRPRTKTRLVSFLVAYHGHKMSEGEALRLVENLSQAGHLVIDAKGKIIYHFPTPPVYGR